MVLLRYWCSTPTTSMAFPRTGAAIDAKPLSVDTVSNDLAAVASAATGERVTGKWWRHAAATWLLRNGLDVETVAALGGWANTNALRKHYVRATKLDVYTARRVAGLDEPGLGRHRSLAPLPPLEPARAVASDHAEEGHPGLPSPGTRRASVLHARRSGC